MGGLGRAPASCEARAWNEGGRGLGHGLAGCQARDGWSIAELGSLTGSQGVAEVDSLVERCSIAGERNAAKLGPVTGAGRGTASGSVCGAAGECPSAPVGAVCGALAGWLGAAACCGRGAAEGAPGVPVPSAAGSRSLATQGIVGASVSGCGATVAAAICAGGGNHFGGDVRFGHDRCGGRLRARPPRWAGQQ